ncbi:hypothetical protein [Halobacillus seohaensis]|uniref:Uncharacterized protein n=1 Tax=Halobacillus seohaensis TaxID=447421 RepID=A0ABW2ERT1_9BACI
MSDAQFYFEEFTKIHEKVVTRFEQLNAAQSELDKALAREYHELERRDDDYSTADGYEMSKRIKTILNRRRIVKDELVRLQPMYCLLQKNYGQVVEDYRKRSEKGDQLKQSLNATMSIEEVMADGIKL